eukprot:15466260-Alexandrium_andersonii.AAC.1
MPVVAVNLNSARKWTANNTVVRAIARTTASVIMRRAIDRVIAFLTMNDNIAITRITVIAG